MKYDEDATQVATMLRLLEVKYQDELEKFDEQVVEETFPGVQTELLKVWDRHYRDWSLSFTVETHFKRLFSRAVRKWRAQDANATKKTATKTASTSRRARQQIATSSNELTDEGEIEQMIQQQIRTFEEVINALESTRKFQ